VLLEGKSSVECCSTGRTVWVRMGVDAVIRLLVYYVAHICKAVISI
jgi:hypothetical protein